MMRKNYSKSWLDAYSSILLNDVHVKQNMCSQSEHVRVHVRCKFESCSSYVWENKTENRSCEQTKNLCAFQPLQHPAIG